MHYPTADIERIRTNPQQPAQDHVMTEKEAAEFLNLSVRTLQTWRYRGGGPRYFKIRRKLVRYTKSDLLAWLEFHARYNTAEDEVS